MEEKTTKSSKADHLKQYRWKPGESGNPSGRPKATRSIPDILRKIALEEGGKDGMLKIEVVLRKVYQYALEGKSWAVHFIADRTEGKALQSILTLSIDEEDIDGVIESELERLALYLEEKASEEKINDKGE